MFTDTCSASSTGARAAAAAAVEVAAAAGAVVARTRAPSRRPGLPAAGGCMVQPRTPGRRAAHGSAGARRRLCAPRDGSPPSYGYIRSLMKGANEMNLARACLGNSGFRNIPIYMGSHGAERSESQGSTSIRHHSQRVSGAAGSFLPARVCWCGPRATRKGGVWPCRAAEPRVGAEKEREGRGAGPAWTAATAS